jgi:hypothetical protein
MLSDGLAKVMNMVITVTQSILIKERNIVGGVMVVNEMVDLTKKNNDCLILKWILENHILDTFLNV